MKNVVPFGEEKPVKKRGCLTNVLIACGVLFIILVIYAMFSGDSDSSSNTENSDPAPSSSVSADAKPSSEATDSEATVEPTNPEPTQEPESSSSSGTLGDYAVEIKDAVTAKDYKGNPAIVVTYSWTNNSDDTTSAMVAVIAKAFQDGVELESAMIMDDSVYDANSSMKDVRPGTTIDVQKAFLLTSSSDVEVEVSELISFSDDVVSKMFSV